MAEVLGDYEIRVRAKLDDLDRDLRSIKGRVDSDLTGAVDSAEGRFGSFFAGLGKMAGVAAVALGAVGVAAGGMGLAAASANETAAIGFETLLGSAEKAQAFMSDLADFAAKTPFELPGLRDAASRFLAVGVEADRVIPIMTVLGDATSAVGTGSEGIDRAVTALGQMQQKGKVTGEEMLQLVEAGIPAWDALAAKLGVDVATAQDMVSKNQVKVNDLFTALEERAGPALQRVSGMMDKQSASLSGMVSTLKDTVTQGLANAMAPAVDSLKAVLPQITETIGGVVGALGPSLQQLFAGLAPAIGPIVSVVGKLAESFLPIIGMLGEALGPVLGEVADLFGELRPEIMSVAGTFMELVKAVSPLVVPVLALVSPLLRIAALFGNVLVGAAMALVPVIVQVADVFQRGLQQTITALEPILVEIAVAFVELLEAVIPLLPTLVQIAVAFLPLLPAIVELLPPIIELATVLIGLLAPVLTVVAGIIESVVVPIIGFLAAVLSDPAAAADMLAKAWDIAWAWVMRKVGEAKDWVGEKIGEVVDFVKGLPGRALDALGDLGSLLLDAGKKLIGGFIDGIFSMFGKVRDTLGNLTSKLTSWKGPPGRDATLLYGTGQLVIGGFVSGIRDSYGDVRAALSGVTSLVAAEGSVSLTAGEMSSRGGGPTIIVQGSVVAERQLLDLARRGVDDVGRHNVSSGVKTRTTFGRG